MFKMCGIVGLFTRNDMNNKLCKYLMSLQHRGQDSYGYTDGTTVERYLGTISTPPLNLKGNISIGHTRYRTSGRIEEKTCQPLQEDEITLVHNGHVHIDNEYSDTYGLLKYMLENKSNNIIETIKYTISTCKGSFFVIMIYNGKIYAFKDNNGIRPGLYGVTDDGDIVISSENCYFEKYNIKLEKDIYPGDIIEIDDGNITYHKGNGNLQPCIFEYIYLSHPDSTLYNVNVRNFRESLAASTADLLKDITVDAICGVPNSSRIYGLEVARVLRKPYFEPLVKKKRSFIMPTQEDRERYLKEKFTFLDHHFVHNRVLLVDDSIVRGSTAKVLVKTFKDRGCEVVFLSCSPKVVNKNVFGINITTKKELLSYKRTHKQIEEYLGCKVIYQTIDKLYKCSGFKNLEISKFLD